MGGLVSRAAAMLSGAKEAILGVIHGAQPVLGAPAAYKRMRAGFESDSFVFRHALGASSEDVMPVMAHSVGALELLPNTQYKTNHGEAKWLKMTKDGLEIESLPSGDPYSSIYEDANSFLRLAYHPEYISPLTADKSSPDSALDSVRAARKEFVKKLRLAATFHQNLNTMCHKTTYSSWVGHSGLATWDRIEYLYLRDHAKPHTVKAYGVSLYTSTDADPSEGTGTDYWENKEQQNRKGYYQIQGPDGYGDGTVPESSGAALRSKSKGVGNRLNIKVIGSVEHSQFYNNADVSSFTMACIYELTQKQFTTRLPTASGSSKGKASR